METRGLACPSSSLWQAWQGEGIEEQKTGTQLRASGRAVHRPSLSDEEERRRGAQTWKPGRRAMGSAGWQTQAWGVCVGGEGCNPVPLDPRGPRKCHFPASAAAVDGGCTRWVRTNVLLYLLSSLSRVRLCDRVDCSPLPGFSRILQGILWSGWPCPPPGHLPDPGVRPGSPARAGEVCNVCTTSEAFRMQGAQADRVMDEGWRVGAVFSGPNAPPGTWPGWGGRFRSSLGQPVPVAIGTRRGFATCVLCSDGGPSRLRVLPGTLAWRFV